MSTTNSLLALVVFSLLAAVAPPASAAPTDACALVTQAQVSAALGVPVAAGTYVTPSYTKTCTFTPSSGATADVKALTISLQDASGYQTGKQLMAAAAVREGKDPSQLAGSASGIGDDAYYTTMGAGYTGLMVKEGNSALKIAIYGNLAADKKKAVEKAIALQAVMNM